MRRASYCCGQAVGVPHGENCTNKGTVTLDQTEDNPLGHKELKPARSQAELTRVKQGWALIVLSSVSAFGAIVLVGRSFGVW
jgi:hypothetical protein